MSSHSKTQPVCGQKQLSHKPPDWWFQGWRLTRTKWGMTDEVILHSLMSTTRLWSETLSLSCWRTAYKYHWNYRWNEKQQSAFAAVYARLCTSWLRNMEWEADVTSFLRHLRSNFGDMNTIFVSRAEKLNGQTAAIHRSARGGFPSIPNSFSL